MSELTVELVYRCPICKEVYATEEQAQECLDTGVVTSDEFRVLEVGDIVASKQAVEGRNFSYTWGEGDPDWQLRGPCEWNGRKYNGYGFMYVVTAITQDRYQPHKLGFHLAGLGKRSKDGTPVPEFAWTSHQHWTMKKVPNPPQKVIDESKQFIGNECSESQLLQ